VAEVVKASGVTRLALPMGNAAFPRNAAQLRALEVGDANCAPTPEARLLKALQAQADEARKLLADEVPALLRVDAS
jgi:hypothetical protein